MGFAVFAKTIRDQRLTASLAGVVMALIALMDVLIWPEYRDGLKDFEIPEAMKALLGEAGSISTPEGFVTAEFFSWISLVLITIAIIAGTGVIAGEEGSGTLELLLAQPIRRWRLLAEKSAGVAVALAGTAAISYLGFVAGKRLADLPVTDFRLAQAVAFMLPITLLYLAVAVAAAAALPNRSSAAMLCIGLVIADFFVNTIGGAVASLHGMRKVSAFYWSDAGHILLHGFDWTRAAALLGIAALVFVVALAAFERRDITSGGREIRLPWVRAWPARHGADARDSAPRPSPGPGRQP